MATALSTSHWALTIPDTWEWDESDECVTIYDPDGCGALQIRGYEKETPVTAEDLRDFAQGHLRSDAVVSELTMCNAVGISFAFEKDEAYWIYWLLRKHMVMVVATYNCGLEDKGEESQKVAKLLASLRIC
jgi:hypothetical protein